MNRYSEVEAKFDAAHLTHDQFQKLVRRKVLKNMHVRQHKIRVFKLAEGTDTFFQLGSGVVRFRRDRVFNEVPKTKESGRWCSMFTVKSRRSDANLLNRKEVDIALGDRGLADVRAFMDLLGAKTLYSIEKDYSIFMLEHVKLGIHVCLAMYDVCRPGGRESRRFLEVEIERDSKCSAKVGGKVLRTWIQVLQDELNLSDPLNVSLYELYGKGKA